MDWREFFNDKREAIRAAVDALSSDTWTASPGRIISFDAASQTASVQAQIAVQVQGSDGTTSVSSPSPCQDVPVVFPNGGGFSLTFPITAGDDCLLVFCSRSIDEWFLDGSKHPPHDLRKHDLSDAIAIVGIRPKPRVLPSYSTTSTQIRSDDLTMVIDLNHTTGSMTMTAPTMITLDVPEVVVTGALEVQNTGGAAKTAVFNGTIKSTVDVIANDVSLKHHTHTGVQGGSGTSGTPTGGYS